MLPDPTPSGPGRPGPALPGAALPDPLPSSPGRPDLAPPSLLAPDGGGPLLSSGAPFIPAPLPAALAIPAIPVSAGAMIFDRAGRLLILKPTYKSGWTIPGGVMEADGETPWDACRREVREECGLDVRAGRLACVDFRRPRPARPGKPGNPVSYPGNPGKPGKPGNPGGIRFLFDCGRLDDASLAAVVLQPEEISEHRLARLPVALKLLRKPIRRRVAAARRTGAPRYLENGRPVPGISR